jgi:CRP-like cAMP-binding protein
LLAPHLREGRLIRGDLLHRPGEQIEQVYFLTSGIVSLMAILEGGTTVETVSVGHEGAIGTIEGFGPLQAFTSAKVQVSGSASRISGPIFRRILDEKAEVKETINHLRRASVSDAASTLRDLEAIEYRRAVIKILDRKKLEEAVCECYSTIRRAIDVGFRKTHTQ